MKVVILAGGMGTRLSEETESRPKPMVEIGGRPMLWHIMRHYRAYGHDDFVILAGYRADMIEGYFSDHREEDWRVQVVDTGLETLTGTRIQRARHVIGEDDFLLTYGDGVSDIDLDELVRFHRSHGKALTVTAVWPEPRFGALQITQGNRVASFVEKPRSEGARINGGFFVCSAAVFNFIPSAENLSFETSPMESMARAGELYAYLHDGFWKPMDTLRDKHYLEQLWHSGAVKWTL